MGKAGICVEIHWRKMHDQYDACFGTAVALGLHGGRQPHPRHCDWLRRVVNEHVLHGLSVALNVKGGRGFTKQSAVVRRMGVDAAGGHGKKCKHRKLAY